MGSSILQLLGRQQLEQAQGTAQTPAGRLNTTVALSDGMDVQSVSEAEQLARTLNIPVAQVMGNIASARASALRQRSEELARNAPIATNWVASSPERASLARNDLENLGFFERLFGSPGVDQATGRKSVLMPRGTTPLPPRNQGLLGAEWDRAALNGELGRLQFDLSPAQRQLPENQQRIRALKDKIAAYQLPESRGAAETALRSAATILPSLVSGTAAGGIAAGIGAGAAFVVGAPVAAVAGTAFTAGMLARGIREQAGGDIDRNLSVPGVDPVVADRAGRISGLVSGSIEAVATRLFLKPFAALLPKAAPAAASKILAQPTTRAAVLNGVKAWGGAVAAETGTEVAQQAISLASEQYVRQASGAPGIEGGRVVEELVETAITTAAGMALLGVPGGVVTTVNDLGKIEQAKDNQRFLSALGDLSTESDLRKNSTDEFRSFIEDQVANYGPVRDISVPVERFNAYWQERNVDPRIIAAEVLRDITGYDQAVASGGDVVIPLADYVAKIAPTEHHAGLVEDIRLRPGDLTAREAKEQEAQVTADLEGLSKELSDIAQQAAVDADAMRVIEDVTAKIEATGVYTADQVAAMARSIAAPYIVLGRRSGQSPWQVYSSRNINILAPVQAERLYDAIAEMESELTKDPMSPAAIAAIQNVNTLRGEIEQLPGGAAVAERALTPMVMPIGTVDVGQRVVLADGRSAVVTGREAGNVVVRMAGAPEGETTPIAGDREVEVTGAVLRQARTVPTPRLEATANLRAVFDFARKNQFRVNRDFKLALQARAQEAAAEDGVDLTEFNTATLDYLVRVGLADAEYAMETNPNAIGWYERKVREALAISALTYPEIETDQNARFAFIVALAVTSNGMKVDKNFELADQVYRAYRETGQMPTNVKAGTAQGAMNTAFKLFNELVPLYGMDTLRQAMITQFDVGTLKAMGFKITGEHVDVIVRGAAIFGPKIGNGFFANLYGFFDALTIDRWLMRTWGRWTGNLVEDRPDMVAEKSTELARLVTIISQNAEAKQTIEKMLKISLDAPIEDIGRAVRKASAKEDNRAVMNELMLNGEDVGYQLRLVGNSLAGYLDGQIEAPTADVRKKIRGVFQRVLEQLQVNNPDLTMADLQALLWYPEKRLYDSAVMEVDEAEAEYADDEAPDYSNAAAKLARSKGITEEAIQDVLRRERAIDGRTAAARRQLEGLGADPAASADVEGLSRQARRNFVARSVLRRLRSDIAGDGTKSETYARKGRGVRASLRLLGQTVDVVGQYTPSIKFRNRIEAANGTALEFFELAPNATSAQVFTDAITAAKNSTPFGAAVFVYAPEDYAGMRLFVAEDGQTGFALKPDGDIVSVFSYGVPGGARGAIELAIQQGGRKLDAFATVLPEYYFAHGMREVARLPWDDTQAPPDWDTNTFADFNDGRPDVVFMVFDPEFSGPYEVAPYVADYGAALVAQDRAIADLDTRAQPMVAPQVLRQAVSPSDESVARLLDRAMDPSYAYEVLPETIEVDGVKRPTRNSWGYQITPTAKAMRAFWRWFGDSKVTDKWGRPIMMYHGTVAEVDFGTFRLNPLEMGVHVGNPNQASDRVDRLSGGEPSGETVGPRVMELYVKADNPLRLIDEGGFVPRRNVIPQLVDIGIISTERAFELQQIAEKKTIESYKQVYDGVVEALRTAGYDSIVYLNRIEGLHPADINKAVEDNYTVEQRIAETDEQFRNRFSSAADSYIVFTKQQVKSPANVGTFSPRLASTMRQQVGDRPNAFIIPGVRRTTIGLMNTANLSSLLHEFAHDYLNLLFDVAAMPEATEQIKADAALVLKEFGVTDKMDLTVEHQERWARMFESYLEEGKAPTRALDRAFARFRAWMTAIYRTARNVLVPVSPEIRGVFDRMLATDEEIAVFKADRPEYGLVCFG